MTIEIKTAVVKGDREEYWYELRRICSNIKPLVNFVGLNPSTADADKNDPTISKCISYAKNWGYGGIIMTNAFAYRETDPNKMIEAYKSGVNVVGKKNDYYIKQAHNESEITVVCWGGVLTTKIYIVD